MSIKKKMRMLLVNEGKSNSSLAGLFNVTENTMRNKMSKPIEVGTFFLIHKSLGYQTYLVGPKGTRIPISYEDCEEDQKAYEEGPHREYKP